MRRSFCQLNRCRLGLYVGGMHGYPYGSHAMGFNDVWSSMAAQGCIRERVQGRTVSIMTGVCPALVETYHSIRFVILAYLGIYQNEAVPIFLCLFNLLEQSLRYL